MSENYILIIYFIYNQFDQHSTNNWTLLQEFVNWFGKMYRQRRLIETELK